jgi:hypothetical protein
MAAIAFKQACPSCEHPIPIRDAGLVGKKIECPKCKYRLVVQKPKESAEEAVSATPAPAAKGAKQGTAVKAKVGALRHIEEDEHDDAVATKKKSRKKLFIGLGLASVGLLVLALASFIILGKGGSTTKKGGPSVPFANKGFRPVVEPNTDDPPKVVTPNLIPQPKPVKVNEAFNAASAGPELTNLLPNDTEHVFHGFFKEVFDALSPFRNPIAGDPRLLADAVFKPRLGFAIADIDDFLRADRFTREPWTFTVIHLKEPVDEAAIAAAFALKPMPAIGSHNYFKASKPNPWFDQLSHIAVGVPQWLRVLGRDDSRPLCVRFHNRQTLIFASEAPLQELLKNNLQFPLAKDDDAKRAVAADADEQAAILHKIQTKSYLTVKLKLKEVLDRLEAKASETPEKLLFSTATELDPARVLNNLLPPDERGKFVWRGKQIWDLATFYEERKPRVAVAGSALVERDARSFQYRADFDCIDEKEARSLLKVTNEEIAPIFAANVERYLGHKIDIPKPEAAFNPADPDPTPKKDQSRWEATQHDQNIDVRVDFFLDIATLGRVQTLTSLFAMAARAEVDVVSDARGRHQIGQAAVQLAEQGRPDRKIPAGAFPPGTLKRPGTLSRVERTPYYRLSWMTSLLPYLGHQTLYDRIDFDKSWRDPVNWLPARTTVSEFLDGSYPDAARFVAVSGIAVAPAATHIVGITGVGHDAAEYPRDDPAFADKRGVFSYDRSATVAEIQKGRGAANIIMMMQVPHDGVTGVAPWIAGGGSTLRGVPEKNSLAPFVLTNDKDGKPITYKGKRGTYVIMADSSVRFLGADTPDDVVKMLVTIQGPAPKADFFGEDQFPTVPDPGATSSKPAPKVAQAAKTPPVGAAPKAAPKLDSPPPPKAADDEKKQ